MEGDGKRWKLRLNRNESTTTRYGWPRLARPVDLCPPDQDTIPHDEQQAPQKRIFWMEVVRVVAAGWGVAGILSLILAAVSAVAALVNDEVGLVIVAVGFVVAGLAIIAIGTALSDLIVLESSDGDLDEIPDDDGPRELE